MKVRRSRAEHSMSPNSAPVHRSPALTRAASAHFAVIMRPSIVNSSALVQIVQDERGVNGSFVIANFYSSSCPFSAELEPLFNALPQVCLIELFCMPYFFSATEIRARAAYRMLPKTCVCPHARSVLLGVGTRESNSRLKAHARGLGEQVFGEQVRFIAMDAQADRGLNMRYNYGIGGYPSILCFRKGMIIRRSPHIQ